MLFIQKSQNILQRREYRGKARMQPTAPDPQAFAFSIQLPHYLQVRTQYSFSCHTKMHTHNAIVFSLFFHPLIAFNTLFQTLCG